MTKCPAIQSKQTQQQQKTLEHLEEFLKNI